MDTVLVDRALEREPLYEQVADRIMEGVFVTDRVKESPVRTLDLICKSRGWRASSYGKYAPLEIVIAKLAAMRAHPEDIQQLEEHTDAMEVNLDNLEEHRAANERFHLALAVSSKNELFPSLIQPLVVLMKETRILTNRLPDAARISVERHRKLIAAIRARDAGLAEQIMREHMDDGAKFLAIVASGERGSSARTDL